jgi:hypothetical protein
MIQTFCVGVFSHVLSHKLKREAGVAVDVLFLRVAIRIMTLCNSPPPLLDLQEFSYYCFYNYPTCEKGLLCYVINACNDDDDDIRSVELLGYPCSYSP